MTHAGARGAACVLEAEQMCLSVRGERRPRARAHAQFFAGVMAEDGALARRFLATVASGRPAPARAPARRGRR
jgi:GTP cyclohydrolase I